MKTRVEFTSARGAPADRRRPRMELLEVVGMRFGAGDALDALGEAGATVDRATGVARIPRELVERAVAQCPREIVLGGATPEDDCVLTEGVPHFLNSGTPTSILDFRTGERREGVAADLREATTVLDATPSASIIWALVSASDLAPERRTLEELAVMLACTRKHIQHDVDDRRQVELPGAHGRGDRRRPARAPARQRRLLHRLTALGAQRAARRCPPTWPRSASPSSSCRCRSPAAPRRSPCRRRRR